MPSMRLNDINVPMATIQLYLHITPCQFDQYDKYQILSLKMATRYIILKSLLNKRYGLSEQVGVLDSGHFFFFFYCVSTVYVGDFDK